LPQTGQHTDIFPVRYGPGGFQAGLPPQFTKLHEFHNFTIFHEFPHCDDSYNKRGCCNDLTENSKNTLEITQETHMENTEDTTITGIFWNRPSSDPSSKTIPSTSQQDCRLSQNSGVSYHSYF
jgi:hypothetical protein